MRPGQYLTRSLVFFDIRGVDGAVRGLAAAIGGLAGRWRRWQTGFVRSYAMSMLAGVLVVALARARRPDLREEPTVMSFPWLTTYRPLPLIGAPSSGRCCPAGLPPARPLVAPSSSRSSSLALSVVAALRFDASPAPKFQFAEQHSGSPSSGSATRSASTASRWRWCCSRRARPGRACSPAGTSSGRPSGAAHFFALMLVLETFMVGVFAARDVFLFYVFFEAMLIPVYFLIGQFGGAQRRYAAVKFLLYSLLGGLVMLVAVIALYFQGQGGPQGFLTSNLTGLRHRAPSPSGCCSSASSSPSRSRRRCGRCTPGCRTPPPRHPPGVAVLLVGVLDKVGTFGMITLCLPLFPNASQWAAPVVLALAVISVIYGALLAIGQRDLKRLIAYTSVSHFGFIVLGIFAFTSTGQAGPRSTWSTTGSRRRRSSWSPECSSPAAGRS